MLAALCGACSAYEEGALMPPEPPAPPPIDTGDGGHMVDSATPTGMAGSGAGAGGRPPSGAGAGGDVAPPDRDAQVPPECAELAGGCSPICPEVCNALDDDCDGDADERAADADCAAPNATSVCDQGTCLLVECLDEHRDCDTDPMTGCEVAIDDPNHCGTCGNACDLPNAVEGCVAGVCLAVGCADGYGDCDGDQLSCEVALNSLEHCGECNVPCGGLTNASPQCGAGSCAVQECLGNFGDCDLDPTNGCEQTLDTLEDCGECGEACAKASCVGGVCTAVVCPDPTADCDGDEVDCEVDLSNTVEHCGGCGVACAFTSATPNATVSCQNRSCEAACDADYGDCDENYATGCETPLLTTPSHCNGCGNDCSDLLPHAAQTTCTGGVCGVVTCESGFCNYDNVSSNGCERNTATEGPCSPDQNCVKQSTGGRDYFFCTNASTWQAARDKCRLMQRGDLVAISSSAENAFVQMHRTTNSWIGARDAGIEGLWRWERNGMPFWRGLANGTAQLSQYENWSSAQPDDYQAAEDCAEMWVDGMWNDERCTSTRGFVCEVITDECPSDSAKTEPGQCGCGMVDTDTDGDGFANCVENCDNDAIKQEPGQCGCATADSDSDGDGTANCNDGCPSDPTQQSACLTFAPSNFNPGPINWSAQPATTANCGTTTVNSTDPDGTGPLVATITNWCGTAPVPIAQTQAGGPEVVVIPLRSFALNSGNTLRLVGSRPVILAVDGAVTIAGLIDADASGTTAGAGGNWSCGSSAGGNGSGSSSGGAGGGGGGAFGTAGGQGGSGGGGNRGGGGAVRGNANLVPLFGGCGGGLGGGCSTAGAAGGGAVQISASGTLTVTGTIRANGGVGANGCGSEGGGTGGGSGGGIFLEATTITTTGATMTTNGGRGGNGGGGGNGGNGSTSSGSPGSGGGSDSLDGGGGGGGGYGRIRTLDR
jgi:hypothetical protein